MNSKTYENFINNHVRRILVNSEYQFNYIRGKAEELYEDEYLWCSITKQTVSSKYFRNGLIFAGPEGSGKHSAAIIAANHVACNYMSKGKCELIYISGNDIDFDENILEADFEYRAGMEFNENGYPLNIIELLFDNLINTSLDKLGDESKSCIIIFIDDDGQSKLINKLYQSAAYYLIQCNTADDLPDMFVFAVTNDESEIPHCLKRDLNVIKPDMPDYNERKKLIDIRIKDNELNSLTLSETEGMSMAELKNIIEGIFCYKSVSQESDNEKQKNVVKRLADGMKYRPLKNTGTVSPVVISSGGGTDQTAFISAMEKMGETISKNISANMPNQLNLNEMPDNLGADNAKVEKPDALRISEDAQNSTWREFCAGLGLKLDDTEEEPQEN